MTNGVIFDDFLKLGKAMKAHTAKCKSEAVCCDNVVDFLNPHVADVLVGYECSECGWKAVIEVPDLTASAKKAATGKTPWISDYLKTKKGREILGRSMSYGWLALQKKT